MNIYNALSASVEYLYAISKYVNKTVQRNNTSQYTSLYLNFL